jgi:hypothetical protein
MAQSGMQNIDFEESWQIVREELLADLEQRARKTRLLRRMRGFGSVEILTRLLLMHASGALSLEQMALRAPANMGSPGLAPWPCMTD